MTLKGLAKYKQPFVGSYPDWAKKSHLFIITCIFLFVDVYNPEINDYFINNNSIFNNINGVFSSATANIINLKNTVFYVPSGTGFNLFSNPPDPATINHLSIEGVGVIDGADTITSIGISYGSYTFAKYLNVKPILYIGTQTPTIAYPIPSTPTVPASATAQQNTNPYTVNVYLYGGAVTEIQITRDGTAYTVFSNATGLALSGQVYKLNPSDSITLTYTTAPTWEWLSD